MIELLYHTHNGIKRLMGYHNHDTDEKWYFGMYRGERIIMTYDQFIEACYQ